LKTLNSKKKKKNKKKKKKKKKKKSKKERKKKKKKKVPSFNCFITFFSILSFSITKNDVPFPARAIPSTFLKKELKSNK